MLGIDHESRHPDHNSSPALEHNSPDVEDRLRCLHRVVAGRWQTMFEDQPATVIQRQAALERDARGLIQVAEQYAAAVSPEG